MAQEPEFAPEIEEKIVSTGVATLQYREWRESETQPLAGGMLIVHGFAEHSMRYARWARRLNEAGYRVAGFDFRGMGSSDGVRGYVLDFKEYVEDLRVAVSQMKSKLPPGAPLYLYAHSMGGLVALLALSSNDCDCEGAVISGPLLGVSMTVPGWKKSLSRILIRVAPALQVPLDLEQSSLTHDLEDLARLKSDPLSLKQVTSAWYFASLLAIEQAASHISKIDTPTLWLVAGEEKIVSKTMIHSTFIQMKPAGKHTLKEYPGLYHELHNEREPDRSEILKDVLGWLHRL